MSERFIVTATPPTPNGDFHVGHLSGPYLGADIFTRFQRMRGHTVTYVSSADRNQSYVVTTAERKGVDPDSLSTFSHSEMIKTLNAGRIAMDAFNMVDSTHVELVQGFMRVVESRGHVKRKVKKFPYSSEQGRFLVESYVAGHCPECWSPTAGAICEACGHPNDFSTLELARPSAGAGPIEIREIEIAVLELEAFRPEFERFYASKVGVWRPHILEFAREMLAHRLPDYPLTYPSDWGIPSPLDGYDGQVLNVWAEMLPGLINSTAVAFDMTGKGRAAGTELWEAGSGARLIQFLGYDNSFFFAFVHLALAWAHGDCQAADTILTNEFFELENFKFSTSKNHLIWARDLLAERPVDTVRFYLALANPEYQKMNFTMEAMDTLVDVRLLKPFAGAIDGLARAASHLGRLEKTFMVSASTAKRLCKAFDRFAYFYTIETFSPQRAAEHLSQLLVRMGAGTTAICSQSMPHEAALAEYEYLAGLLQVVLPSVTLPLMPDFSEQLAGTVGRVGAGVWPQVLEGIELGLQEEQLARARQILLLEKSPDLRKAS